MNKLRYCSFLFVFLSAFLSCREFSNRKNPEFYNEINAFKEKDRLNPPPARPILFMGSSSVRLWKSVDSVFKDYKVINRGFGGAKLTDLYSYLDDVVFAYHPRQIILYGGDNDIAFEGVNSETVFKRFKQVYSGIREKMPDVPFVYMSIKPSPGRREFLPIQIRSNELIQKYLQAQNKATFVNIFPLMLDSNGNASADIVVADSIHLNRKGYLIWEEAIRPYLLK